MRQTEFYKDKITLPVDYNGHGVQVFWAGGRTETVSGTTFIAETAWLRVCNTSGSVARLKRQNVDYSPNTDAGLPIPDGTKEVLAVGIGDIYEVEGELDITFARNQDLRPAKNLPTFVESILSTTDIGGPAAVYNIVDNTLEVSGMIDFYFKTTSPELGSLDANRVGAVLSLQNQEEDYPEMKVSVYQMNQQVQEYFWKDFTNRALTLTPAIYTPGEEITIYIWWDGFKNERFTIKIDEDIVLRK